jgi:TPR repeat protein
MAQLTKLSEKGAVAMLPSGEPGTQASPSGKTIRPLDPDEIKVLVTQGEQFAAAGDLVGARVVLRRAAEAGDSTAAVALGATYDPVVLAKIGVVGFSADVEQARSWYRKAESLGSSEATRRLEVLANR